MQHLALLALLAAPTVLPPPVTYLLPLIPGPDVPGAHGSLWSTELVIENSSDKPVTLFHYSCFACTTPPPPGVNVLIPPQSTVRNPTVTQNNGLGAILYAAPADAYGIRLHLRVRDISRQSQTFGTEVPVRTLGYFPFTLRLLDVPVDPRFRVTLRIYSLGTTMPVTVTVLPQSGTAPLLTTTVTLNGGGAQLEPVAGLIGNSAIGNAVRIVVDSPTQQPIWAFASVTNNDTQDVTTITESP